MSSVVTGNCYAHPATAQFTLLSGAKFITGPVGGSIIALTDRTRVESPPPDKSSVPGPYGLKVVGTLPCKCTVKVNGRAATVKGTGWHVVLPNVHPGPLDIDAVASDGKSEHIQVTLIDLRVVTPKDRARLPVTGAPAMPALNATLEVAGFPGGVPQTVNFSWTLQAFNRWVIRPPKQKAQWKQGPLPLAQGTTVGVSAAWTPGYGGKLIGGWGRLVVKAALPGVSGGTVTSSPRWFDMPGTDPVRGDLTDFIKASTGKNAALATTITQIACKESHYRQFGAKSPAAAKETDIPSNLPNPAANRPLFGPPAGIGIMQLDPADYPTQQWNWKTNVLGGIALYNSQKGAASRYPGKVQAALNAQRDTIIRTVLPTLNKQRAAHKPALPVLKPSDIPVATVPAFTADQLTQDAIRGYNGFVGKPLKRGGKTTILHQFTFDARYSVTADLEVILAGSHTWKPTPPSGFNANPYYVQEVLACK
ncbi:hypothetical protein [Actinomadura rupiterrae]|uniref:hypothetical protein n=1 Tax=Actinomadura rupiterrae TaxID=559627 RepID=UPI0020A3EC69|nr:hypothetical protein [Actinomadura rupiterrae]MCP2341564.1 hypothetical protein [Actinomadura rupiterrae]